MSPQDVAIYASTAALVGVPAVIGLVSWARMWPIGRAPVVLRDDGPHEHRYDAVTKPYFPGRREGELHGGVYQLVVGYRCRCGQWRPLPRYSAGEQARWALAHLRARYGETAKPWQRYASGGTP